jgi:hypothetical protein
MDEDIVADLLTFFLQDEILITQIFAPFLNGSEVFGELIVLTEDGGQGPTFVS